jgi:hypothetical protein
MATFMGLFSPPTNAAGTDHAGVVIPLYNYPDATWTTIVQTHALYPNVPIAAVVNPNNGPGTSSDPTFASGIQSLQAGGVKVLGYVDLLNNCECSTKSLTSVKAEVSDYWNWYHVDGILFDDLNNGFTYSPATYASLDSYVKSLGMTYTMGNPGTSIPSSYYGALDNLVISESSGYPSLSSITNSGYPASEFSFVAYGVSYNANFVTSAAALVGYMYIDNLGGSNPYSTLSSLFAQTVQTLSADDAPSGSSSSSTPSTTHSSSTTSPTSTSTTSATSTTSTSSTATTSTTTGQKGGSISLTASKHASGSPSSPYQVTITNFNAGSGTNRLLLVGVSANNNGASSVTFGGAPLTLAAGSFYNNDAELWYLVNPSGTGNVVVTMSGSTSVVVGAYALSGVYQSAPVATTATKYNTGSSSPKISISTKFADSWVVEIASIYGGSTLGSPTCTSDWNVHLSSAVTGASSYAVTGSPGTVTCGWTASPADQWDSVAIEVRSAPGSVTTTTTSTSTSSTTTASSTTSTASTTKTSSTTTTSTSTSTTSTTTTGPTIWRPALATSWNWQLSTTPTDLSYGVQMYDIDLFDNSASQVAAIHSVGAKAVCYIDAGTWENWRPDAGQFPSSVLGKNNGWPGEKWLDIRQIAILGPIMTARVALCAQKGFDGVEFDNVDGYTNPTGFPLTAQNQLTYDEFLANLAHSYGLSVALKNDGGQAKQLLPYFDFAIVESCFDYSECSLYTPFINAGKAVFETQYTDNGWTTSQFCPQANALNFNAILKHLSLDAWMQACRAPSGPTTTPAVLRATAPALVQVTKPLERERIVSVGPAAPLWSMNQIHEAEFMSFVCLRAAASTDF